jgi:hypothetical protein
VQRRDLGVPQAPALASIDRDRVPDAADHIGHPGPQASLDIVKREALTSIEACAPAVPAHSGSRGRR